MIQKTPIVGFDRGLNKDTPANRLKKDECQDLDNYVYRSGIWTKRDGFTQPYTATGDGFNILEITDYIDANASTLLCATKDSIYYLNGTTWTNRLNLGTTRSDTDKWFFAEGDGFSWAVNGLDVVYRSTDPATTNYTAMSWDTTTVGGSAGTTITRANVVLFMNLRAWYMNVTDGTDGDVGYRIRYTNASDYDRTEGTTGFYDVVDSQSDIISGAVLPNSALVAFKQDMVHILQNTGNPVLSPALRFSPGLIGPKAWTYLPNGGIFYVSPTGFHMFRAGLPEEVGRNKVRKYFFQRLDEQYRDNVYCWTNWQEAELVIHIPTGSGIPDEALIYNWASGVWSTWSFTAYCGFYRYREQTNTNIYFGGASGIVKLSGGADDNGTAISTTITTKAFSPRELMEMNLLTDKELVQYPPNYIQTNRIYTDALPTTATIKVGESDYAREAATYNKTATVTSVDGTQPYAAVESDTMAYLTLQVIDANTISELVVEWTGAGDE